MKFLARFMCFLGFTSLAHAGDRTLHEGDCWSYACRPGEESSFLVIRKLEHRDNGDVAHISVFGVRVVNPGAPNGYATEIAHLPITLESLRGSVRQKLDRTLPECDWQEGYRMWQDAHGGAFTEPVSECVRFVEETIARGHKKA